MVQGCDAHLCRLIILGGRCAADRQPASSARRHTWVVTHAGKAACAGKGVCPGCRRCSYVFIVARVALLRLVGGSTRLWRRAALVRGAFCVYRSMCWLLALFEVWQFEPFELPGVWWSSMGGSVSAGSAGIHLFPAYRRHRMGCPARCGSAWTAAGRLVRLWGAVFVLARTCGERAPNDLLGKALAM